MDQRPTTRTSNWGQNGGGPTTDWGNAEPTCNPNASQVLEQSFALGTEEVDVFAKEPSRTGARL